MSDRQKRNHSPVDELSYEVHTNRELELMLQGRKPLAYFSDMIFDDHGIHEPDEGFERQVRLGAFVKHEAQELWEPCTVNGHLLKGRWILLYALRDEAWRIPAFLLLKKIQAKCEWSDALERLEGTLLGYTDEQNDEWLAKRHERAAGWACVTLYATATAQVLEEIAELGMRAFPKESLSSVRFFNADRIPGRAALEQAGLFSAEAHGGFIRFGVDTRFFKANVVHAPSSGLALLSFHESVRTKDLNSALRTKIQVFDPV